MVSGNCVSRSTYLDNEACSIEFSRRASLSTDRFDTEFGYDFVTVYDPYPSGASFSGTTGFSNVMGTLMSWSTDGSVIRSGWKICAN